MAEERAGGEADGESFSGEKFTGESELQHGPVTNRGCTDIICLILFIVHIVAFWFLSFQYASADSADAKHLYKPRDYKGGYCSLDPYGSQEYMIYTLNMTKTVDSAAETALCSVGYTVGETSFTTAGVTEDDYENACPSSSAVSDFTASAQSTVEKYTTIDGVTELLSGGTSSIFSSVTSYFNQVCVTQCGIDFTTDSATGNYSGVSGARTYVYEPSADKVWASVWTKVVIDNPTTTVGAALASTFTFDALSEASCPYDTGRASRSG